ncbi:hypothetical protein SEA_DRHAYES_89 [Mycobacterium phage DrHayes]|uniref:Uncharacterized protein n=2 Tax=Anayavirus TaxID=2946797 RepID=A0A222Z1V6_9CAUD|nr:hypothetical protein I5G95_gp13 [Mycobacterium phage Bella96]YP_009954070.1 hypothetical protein I5H07_gp14 [Mycobacterium phage Urkel]AOZ61420.1 hypothetical protein SEA_SAMUELLPLAQSON_89 [Mycobacterium phage SamuelLPlaqson]AOZ61517.1 hypothetical protein SEA_DRHAYES_89 [Mycobacterium phage DrHayes]AOZ61614.1 hypothetical protein SEA_URKEL_89 [Mycobacterium phage Urkel]ASR78020.1 hypothetical protein SEA_BELLA96_90 [Mycobacterium phage Bella96]
MTDLDTRLDELTPEQAERLTRSLQRFNEAMGWQLDHARQELDRDRLRRLFGPARS